MAVQSEAQLEQKLFEQLVNLGYQPIQLKDYDALLLNFRNQINRFNEKKLYGKPLTDIEFNRLLTKIDGKSIFESAKILRDKQEIEREDGSKLFIELFNTREWCKNLFQVTNQTSVEGTYINRYDVTLLVNGLPIVQIELKRRGLDFKEAFHQIMRYRKHSFKGLYRFIQMFVISNGVDTKYFSNSDKEILYGYTFFWSDEKNNIITNLKDFTMDFLDRCRMAKMISRYMVLNETENLLMVMRPYQVYAVESLVERALETRNNGYIWHTTGSGKTLTSFKASQILANEPGIKKVFFLVDRRDLDSQTLQEFNKFEKGSVDTTDRTDLLVKQIDDMTKPFIVTTIQKMANAVKNPRYTKTMEKYRDDRVVFIIDECHRSQFGEMHTAINRHFHNAQFFGFTGTPRFPENKSQDGRTTADLFEKCLHSYLVKDAIRDHNVLGFSVEYISTVRGNFDEEDDTRVDAIDTDEVWMHEDRLRLVVENILTNHERKSRSKGYTAIFTVQSIPMLVKYYNLFKQYDHNLKIVGIYTYAANEESEGRDEHSRDSLETMMKDYNAMFGSNFSTDMFQQYFADVSNNVKSAKIDILLVVNMFLTGFDSKKLNTLYTDKNLRYHDLIQAYSRTNRIESDNKPFGNIVNYRNLKKNTDDAIRLFSQTGSVDDVLMKSYEEYLSLFRQAVQQLYSLAKTPESVDEIEGEEAKREFILAFRELTRLLVRLKSFTEFSFDEDELLINEYTYDGYKSKYLKLADEAKRGQDKESILQDLDFELELIHTDRINVDYILNLIRDIDLENRDEMEKQIREIEDEMDRSDSPELRRKIDLIKTFLNKVLPNLPKYASIDEAFQRHEEEEREKEIGHFADEVGISDDELKEYIKEYEFSYLIPQSKISDSIKAGLLKKRKLVKQIVEFIIDNTEKYM